MAITKLGVIIVGVRGTIGGVTFSANKSGTYAKSLVTPSNPGTVNQVDQRAILATLGAKWRALSTAQQTAWDTFAASPPETDTNSLGQTYLLSGFGWFSRITIRRERCGQVYAPAAPTSTPTAAPASFGLTLNPATGAAGDASFQYTSGDFTGIYAILEISVAAGQGSNVQTSRYLMQHEGQVIGATSTDFGVRYHNTFGVTKVGQRFFGRLYRQSASGIRSVPSELFTDVVP